MKSYIIKRSVALVLLVVLLSFSSIAFAKNFDIAFNTLIPNDSTKYDGHGYKVDTDTYCYITTNSGTVITENLYYRMRGQEVDNSNLDHTYYLPATERSLSYRGTVSRLMLEYVDNTNGNYYTNIRNGYYGQYRFALGVSLHSGSGSYNRSLNGVWNP